MISLTQIAHYYFDPYHAGAQIPFADPLAQSLVEKCGTWSITTTMLETELRRQNVSAVWDSLTAVVHNRHQALHCRARIRGARREDGATGRQTWLGEEGRGGGQHRLALPRRERVGSEAFHR